MEFSESDIDMNLACNNFLGRGEPSFAVSNWIADPIFLDDYEVLNKFTYQVLDSDSSV
jgi:hypothetical protein